jgi:hypothetical protein
VTFVPLLAALTDNLPGLLFVGFIIVASIVQQITRGKKAYDEAVARQRAERAAAGGTTAAPAPQPAQPAAMPQNAAQARALLLAEIDAMANARGQSAQQAAAVVQQPAPQPAAVPAAKQRRTTVQQRPAARPAMWQDPGFGRTATAQQAVDRSLTTLPGTLATAGAPGGLLTTTTGRGARSSTRRMLATAFGDPAHARSSVILAEVLGTPLGLR